MLTSMAETPKDHTESAGERPRLLSQHPSSTIVDTVKFIIEITRRDGDGEKVIRRSTVNVIGPKGAMTAAMALLKSSKNQGANGARVLNRASEEVYRWEE